MTDSFVMNSPVGYLFIETCDDTVVGLEYSSHKRPSKKRLTQQQSVIKKHIQAYFLDNTQFNLNLELSGTAFQQKVWSVLQKIPAGKIKTYGDVAKQLNSSPRAVGNACRANPIPLIVPCHRVVSKTGIGGFSGKTRGASIDRKRWLLAHEGVCL